MKRIIVVASLVFTAPALADFQRLYAEKAEASSFLKSNWNKYNENYHPSYILDDNAKTAWVEGAQGTGIGESITWEVSRLDSVRRVKLRILNGYQKRKGLMTANAAPAVLDVALLDAKGGESGAATWKLKNKMGWQELVVDLGGKPLARVKMTIRKAHKGRKYEDNCISDVQVFVDSEVRYSAKLEKRKHEALTKWIKERKKTAAYFASLPKKYPFAATHYVEASVQNKAEKVPLDKALFAEPKGGMKVDITRKGSAPKLPDGLPQQLDGAFVDVSDTSFFETKKDFAFKRSRTVDVEDWETEADEPTITKLALRDWKKTARATFFDEARTKPKVVSQAYVYDEEGRGGVWKGGGTFVYRYNEQQLVQSIALTAEVPEIGEMKHLWTFSYDKEGRVTEVLEQLEVNGDPQAGTRYVAGGES